MIEWIDASQRLPDNDRPILTFRKESNLELGEGRGGLHYSVFLDRYDNKRNEFMNDSFFPENKVEYWSELNFPYEF